VISFICPYLQAVAIESRTAAGDREIVTAFRVLSFVDA
jgi:hypothetical protein